MRPADPGAYGRLICDENGILEAIVEAKDATAEQRAIGLCNSGVMAIDARHLASLLAAIGTDNAKGEYYLTDIVAIARRRRASVAVPSRRRSMSLSGSTSRADLAAAEAAIAAPAARGGDGGAARR